MPTLIGVKLREIMFRLLTGQIGKNPKFGFGSKILNAKNITIGNNFDMGDFSHVIGGGELIIIGNDFMCGQNVQLIAQNHGYSELDKPMRSQYQPRNGMVIGDDVWIGTNSVVNSGSRHITIAKGVIIGSNSVVLKDCNVEYGIYAGVPAKFIKSRFGDKHEKDSRNF